MSDTKVYSLDYYNTATGQIELTIRVQEDPTLENLKAAVTKGSHVNRFGRLPDTTLVNLTGIGARGVYQANEIDLVTLNDPRQYTGYNLSIEGPHDPQYT